MQLVTFQVGSLPPRAGALVAGGRKVVDLQASHRKRYKKASPLLSSVLAMAEAGDRALDLAGCGLESLRFLKPGDMVELEVEGIGILRNRVVK